MSKKVLLLDKSVSRYNKLADMRAEKEDFSGALMLLLDAEKIAPTPDVISRIAYAYADMGLFELSNKYWYKFMHFAPTDRVSTSYEELAINYYYLDNLWPAGYYFHKKLETDGYISKEGIDQEVLDFFSGEEFKKHAYRIVYPVEKADYTPEIKASRRAITLGVFEEAINILTKIPIKGRDEDVLGDLAIAYFMSDDLENARKTCKQSIEMHGENITAYCNLATVYDLKEDFDKSEYYYRKALSLRTGNKGDYYKVATCAIEREDHAVIKECLEKVLHDRPYELTMRFFYGVALANLGEYKAAYEQFKYAYRHSPDDVVFDYYCEYLRTNINGEDADKLFPLKYVKEIPKKTADKWIRRIRDLTKNPEKISVVTKNDKMRKIIKWGITYGSESVMRNCAFILSNAEKRYFIRTALSIFIDPEVTEPAKRMLLYLIVACGHKGRIGLVAGTFYCDFTLKKLAIEKDPNGALYFSAYALCLSKMAFYKPDCYDKIAECADAIFKKCKGIITESEASNEEIAALILSECKFERFSADKEVKNILEISDYKLKKLKEILNRN